MLGFKKVATRRYWIYWTDSKEDAYIYYDLYENGLGFRRCNISTSGTVFKHQKKNNIIYDRIVKPWLCHLDKYPSIRRGNEIYINTKGYDEEIGLKIPNERQPPEAKPKLPMLTKLLKMTTSSNDGEALVAIRKANAYIKQHKLTWDELLE